MRIFSIICISLWLISCSSGDKKQFQRLYYRFPEPQAIELPIAVDIQKPTALGILANRPLVAVDSSGALKQMNYSFWLESPKVLLNNYLNDLLISPNKEQKHSLYSQILKFEKQANLAIVKINFKLIDSAGAVVFEKTYEKQQTATDKSVGQFVKNMGLMIEQICSELIKDIQ